MANNRKEEIIMATLELAAEHGLGNVSTNMIADKVGIKKPSLYNHFSSKEEIVEEMYRYLREQAKQNANIAAVDYGTMFAGKTAFEVLWAALDNYKRMNHNPHMRKFYQVIYSQRTIEPVAAQIMAEETQRMLFATKQLFYAMQIHGLLHFHNPDMSAVAFAMTVHGLMEYEVDLQANHETTKSEDDENNLLYEYVRWFAEENSAVSDEGV